MKNKQKSMPRSFLPQGRKSRSCSYDSKLSHWAGIEKGRVGPASSSICVLPFFLSGLAQVLTLCQRVIWKLIDIISDHGVLCKGERQLPTKFSQGFSVIYICWPSSALSKIGIRAALLEIWGIGPDFRPRAQKNS